MQVQSTNFANSFLQLCTCSSFLYRTEDVSDVQKRPSIILLSHHQSNTNTVHGLYACHPPLRTFTILLGEFACDVDVHRFGNSFACPSDNRITIVHRTMLHKGIEMAGVIPLPLPPSSLANISRADRGDERLIFVPRAAFPNLPSLLRPLAFRLVRVIKPIFASNTRNHGWSRMSSLIR